jgi:hypothetical protein
VPGAVAVAVGVGAVVAVVPLLSQVTVNASPLVSAEGVASGPADVQAGSLRAVAAAPVHHTPSCRDPEE